MDGTKNETRRTVPATVVTAIAAAVATGPWAAASGVRVTDTCPVGIVPVGKPLPIRLCTVTPGWPTLGATAERFTCACDTPAAANNRVATPAHCIARREKPPNRDPMICPVKSFPSESGARDKTVRLGFLKCAQKELRCEIALILASAFPKKPFAPLKQPSRIFAKASAKSHAWSASYSSKPE